MNLLKKLIPMVLILISPLAGVCGQSVPAAPSIQAIMFSKVFSYVRTVGETKIIIAYSSQNGDDYEAITESFLNEGIEAIPVEAGALKDSLFGASVIYYASEKAALEAGIENREVLTISGDPELVRSGKASIGVGIENDKIRLYINLVKLKQEKQEVSSELINLAKVIR